MRLAIGILLFFQLTQMFLMFYVAFRDAGIINPNTYASEAHT